jgi:hypothetical protein
MTTTPALGVVKYAPKVVRDYLAGYKDADGNTVPGVLDPAIRVSTDVPANRPTLLVTITSASTGGDDNIVLSNRRIIIHCYHPNEAAAGNLAETVYAHMRNARFVPGSGIYNVTTVGTPARLDDPDDGTPRFQTTLDVLLRANTQRTP